NDGVFSFIPLMMGRAPAAGPFTGWRKNQERREPAEREKLAQPLRMRPVVSAIGHHVLEPQSRECIVRQRRTGIVVHPEFGVLCLLLFKALFDVRKLR